MVCLKGPLELYMLMNIGISFSETFEATIRAGGTQGLIKGGALCLILLAQPCLLGFLFLRILDKILQATVIHDARTYGRMTPPKMGGKAKTEEELEDQLRLRTRIPPVADNKLGPAIAISYDLDDKIYTEPPVALLMRAVLFRGSRPHLIAVMVIIPLWILSVFILPIDLQPIVGFSAVMITYGPAFLIYLCSFAIYAHLMRVNTALIKRNLAPFYTKLEAATRAASVHNETEKMISDKISIYEQISSEPAILLQLSRDDRLFFLNEATKTLRQIEKRYNPIWKLYKISESENYRHIPYLSEMNDEVLVAAARWAGDLASYPTWSKACRAAVLYTVLMRRIRRVALWKSRRYAFQLTMLTFGKRIEILFWNITTWSSARALLIFSARSRRNYREAKAVAVSREKMANLPSLARQLSILGEDRETVFLFLSSDPVYALFRRFGRFERFCKKIPVF